MADDKSPEQRGSPQKAAVPARLPGHGGAVVAVDALVAVTPAAAAAVPAAAPAAATYPASKGTWSTTAGNARVHHLHALLFAGPLRVQNLSRARIQIMQDSFGKFPGDVIMAPCRQCKVPVCVQSCPVGAAYVDTENGNVRRIDSAKCIGCKTCLKMCPQQPHRTVWVMIDGKGSRPNATSASTPRTGTRKGAGGSRRAESCPMKAIRFVAEMPDQKETEG